MGDMFFNMIIQNNLLKIPFFGIRGMLKHFLLQVIVLNLFVVACDHSYYEERGVTCVGESSIPPGRQRMLIVIRLLDH